MREVEIVLNFPSNVPCCLLYQNVSPPLITPAPAGKNRTVQNVIRTSQKVTTIDLSFELSIGQTIAILKIFDFYNQLRTKVTLSVSISMYAVVQPSTTYSSTRKSVR